MDICKLSSPGKSKQVKTWISEYLQINTEYLNPMNMQINVKTHEWLSLVKNANELCKAYNNKTKEKKKTLKYQCYLEKRLIKASLKK